MKDITLDLGKTYGRLIITVSPISTQVVIYQILPFDGLPGKLERKIRLPRGKLEDLIKILDSLTPRSGTKRPK